MAENNHPIKEKKFRFKPQWILFIVVLGVVALSILAIRSPMAERSQRLALAVSPSSEVAEVDDEATSDPSGLTTPQKSPPTEEEIGNTNGIIFWSTLLVLILLVGTLRETLYRNGE